MMFENDTNVICASGGGGFKMSWQDLTGIGDATL
jgi:thiamine pyrophosphate-dependent acetolactate synthase large subunit-like protein